MLNVVGRLGDFNDPDAEMMEWFRSRLVDAADEFWARNPGDVGFFVETDGRRSYVVLNYVPDRGYHVLFKGPGDRVDWKLVRVDGSDEPVPIYFGGEPEEVPARAFVAANRGEPVRG